MSSFGLYGTSILIGRLWFLLYRFLSLWKSSLDDLKSIFIGPYWVLLYRFLSLWPSSLDDITSIQIGPLWVLLYPCRRASMRFWPSGWRCAAARRASRSSGSAALLLH